MTVVTELTARVERATDPHWDRLVGDHVLDALACMASGRGAPLAARLARLGPLGSLLSRSTLAHVDEFDALHGPAAVVPGAVVVPVAWALAPHGRRLAQAVVAGTDVLVEAALRFGGARLYDAGWWPTALFGALGAAAAAAVCLSLDAATTATALALAAAPLGGLFGPDALADSHYLLVGLAAERGVWAARAAAAGCTGDLTLLDHALGGPEAPTRAGCHLPDVAFKAWPCARPLHAVLAALHDLAADGTTLSDVSPVRIGLPSAALQFVTADPRPAGPAQAAASAAVAVAGFRRGRADDPGWYRAPEPGPPVQLAAAPELDTHFPRRWPAEVTVRGVRRRVLAAPAPSAAQRAAKAARLLRTEPGDPVLERLRRVATYDDLGELRAAVEPLLP